MSTVLTTRERDRIDAYWRAANHLSAGQIYLHDNPLLREPLSMPACTAWPPAKSAYPTIEIWWKGNFRTAGDLYTFMVDRFHQGRAFVMEFLIVFILIIDLIFLFKDA
jgi:hypothetical protein